ncbi:MAG: hypothetical protein K1X36_11035, partial [Pyrinomonadaceae bacterium]|nr:hypothetical protein [Pyrinomonadaceae bacterium]
MDAYSKPIADVLSGLTTTPDGLTGTEASERKLKFGPNELVEKPPASPWVIFLDQFRDLMIVILAAAAMISGWMGDLTDTAIILVIVVLNAVIGFVQEYRAEQAMA